MEVHQAHGLRGTIEVPGDKSISHRSAILGALAKGDTTITNFLPGADCLATLACLRALGVAIEGPDRANRVTVHGHGPESLVEPEDVLNAVNSGTTFRLLAGVLAGSPFFSVLTGDASLRRRPMARIVRPLSEMGAAIHGRQNDRLPPLAIRGGRLQGIDHTLPVASAQVKSAILLAGLFAHGTTSVTEPAPSRDHTERMLAGFGADIQKEGLTTVIRPGPSLSGREIKVPGDISSAAFWLVAATLVPESDILIREVGINPTRDGIIKVLQRMGANLEVIPRDPAASEPVADLHVTSARLRGVEIGGDLIPSLIDEIPVLALAAALAKGRTVIRGAAELKVKESNRLATTAAELRRFGARVEERPDGLVIEGVPQLHGAAARSHGDHRIAMTVLIAGLAARGTTTLDDAACIDVSFPGFTGLLKTVAAQNSL
ncbi:MAG: 3-phosphoshikimate 1-carboxyvinyltransferase [Thermoanaerobacterales bacterium]|nr:3-phosphoshikimate 1-carboxyvinyltransferase [Bacillota bacterium]MDI6906308.1 3-phosphoshikimate 1-carboxyvinyltransferase [Thermoanaerobacterales bacterium]